MVAIHKGVVAPSTRRRWADIYLALALSCVLFLLVCFFLADQLFDAISWRRFYPYAALLVIIALEVIFIGLLLLWKFERFALTLCFFGVNAPGCGSILFFTTFSYYYNILIVASIWSIITVFSIIMYGFISTRIGLWIARIAVCALLELTIVAAGVTTLRSQYHTLLDSLERGNNSYFLFEIEDLHGLRFAYLYECNQLGFYCDEIFYIDPSLYYSTVVAKNAHLVMDSANHLSLHTNQGDLYIGQFSGTGN